LRSLLPRSGYPRRLPPFLPRSADALLPPTWHYLHRSRGFLSFSRACWPTVTFSWLFCRTGAPLWFTTTRVTFKFRQRGLPHVYLRWRFAFSSSYPNARRLFAFAIRAHVRRAACLPFRSLAFSFHGLPHTFEHQTPHTKLRHIACSSPFFTRYPFADTFLWLHARLPAGPRAATPRCVSRLPSDTRVCYPAHSLDSTAYAVRTRCHDAVAFPCGFGLAAVRLLPHTHTHCTAWSPTGGGHLHPFSFVASVPALPPDVTHACNAPSSRTRTAYAVYRTVQPTST